MNKIRNNIFYIFFALFPVIDILTSFNIRYNILPISIGVIIRGFFLLYAFICTIIYNKNKKLIIYYISLLIFFAIFTLTKTTGNIETHSLINEIKIFLKFWYFPIVLIFLNTFDTDKDKLNKAIKINSLIYILGIIIPLITNTSFNSYAEYSDLYDGVVGWFYSANEIGAILAANLILLYLTLNEKQNNLFSIILIIFNIFTLTLIGTKVALFSIIIITVSIFLIHLMKREKEKKFKDLKLLKTSLILLIISAGLILLSTTSYDIFRRFNSNHTKVEYDSFISRILSGRDISLLKTCDVFKNKNIVHKLFGIGFTNNTNKLRSIEMDIFDIFFGYGLIGLILYFIPLIYYIIEFIKNNKIFNTCNLTCILGALLLLLISTLSGHTLSAPAASIYLALFISLFNIKSQS